MKIAYCGYDFFYSCLQQLLSRQIQVARVFTVDANACNNCNQYTIETCQQHNIPYSFDPIKPADIETLQQQGFDWIISAAYNYKIPELASTGIKGLNIHPTLLPTGRGVWPLPWTILLNSKHSGVTLHKLTQQWDGGDILMQQSFGLAEDENLESLNAKTQMAAGSLLMDFIADPDTYWGKAMEQGKGETWPMPSRQDRTLEWNKNVAELDRICRAFGKSGSFARFEQQDWVVFSLKAWKQTHNFEPGTVVHKTNTEMVIAASDGLVDLLYFSPE